MTTQSDDGRWPAPNLALKRSREAEGLAAWRAPGGCTSLEAG
jgi:hypothetical protein